MQKSFIKITTVFIFLQFAFAIIVTAQTIQPLAGTKWLRKGANQRILSPPEKGMDSITNSGKAPVGIEFTDTTYEWLDYYLGLNTLIHRYEIIKQIDSKSEILIEYWYDVRHEKQYGEIGMKITFLSLTKIKVEWLNHFNLETNKYNTIGVYAFYKQP